MRPWNVAEVGVSAWREWELGVFSLLAEDSKPEAEMTVSPGAYAKDNDKNIVKECGMPESLSEFRPKSLSASSPTAGRRQTFGQRRSYRSPD